MKEVVIVSACRTPIGKFTGALKDYEAPQLGAFAIQEAVKRAGIDAKELDEVIMGNVVQAGLGQNPARQAAIHAKVPHEVPAFTVNKVCGSGLKAAMIGADSIRAGSAHTVLAGGMENMTRAPYILDKARTGYKLFDGKLIDAMVLDGLWDKYNNFHMGMTGELIAEKYKIQRADIDKWALRSHQLSAEATKNGFFKDEIVNVKLPKEGELSADEGIRADSTLEGLAKLKPVFKPDGVVTAGNASQISDGASAVVLMSGDRAKERGIKPMAKVVDYLTSGLAPEWVMEAPVPAIQMILKRNKMTVDDIDLFEHNEAFASATVAVAKACNIPHEKLNVNGGAVALGHPIGCSGARVLTTLLYAMKRKSKNRGLATLCLGGGNAVVMIAERV